MSPTPEEVAARYPQFSFDTFELIGDALERAQLRKHGAIGAGHHLTGTELLESLVVVARENF